MDYALQTKNLCKNFGGFVATNDVNLNVQRGARHALIGPNGAGKTTLINLLTGFLPCSKGQVFLQGGEITSMRQHKRARAGLVRTFQINQLFGEMTVLESVAMVISERCGLGWQFWRPASSYNAVIDEAMGVLELLHLSEVAHQRSANLPYGKQRLVEIGLALAMKPQVLLLDEPAAGVPTGESRELFETIAGLPRNVTVVLVEHDMDLVFRFADRITVLVNGAILVEDTPEVIAAHPLVKQVYLGNTDDE